MFVNKCFLWHTERERGSDRQSERERGRERETERERKREKKKLGKHIVREMKT